MVERKVGRFIVERSVDKSGRALQWWTLYDEELAVASVGLDGYINFLCGEYEDDYSLSAEDLRAIAVFIDDLNKKDW